VGNVHIPDLGCRRIPKINPEPSASVSFPPRTVFYPLRLPSFVLAVLLATARVSAAESSPILKDPPAQNAVTPAKPAAPRVISSQVAALLAAATPKYTPPDPAAAKLVEPEVTDPPRNGIIRLSPYVVRELKLPLPPERDILTAQGRLDRALARHPGLRAGPFASLNNVWAAAMLEEELGIERQKEMLDLLGLLAGAKSGPPILIGRPPFSTPAPANGPWQGLVVPWERK